ncbi:hypothetical protein CLOM_g14501 [Closterium sp. NIES-68]|nr:hypothetical protein CLOM_g14501 [Closterium sp. NIES-68]
MLYQNAHGGEEDDMVGSLNLRISPQPDASDLTSALFSEGQASNNGGGATLGGSSAWQLCDNLFAEPIVDCGELLSGDGDGDGDDLLAASAGHDEAEQAGGGSGSGGEGAELKDPAAAYLTPVKAPQVPTSSDPTEVATPGGDKSEGDFSTPQVPSAGFSRPRSRCPTERGLAQKGALMTPAGGATRATRENLMRRLEAGGAPEPWTPVTPAKDEAGKRSPDQLARVAVSLDAELGLFADSPPLPVGVSAAHGASGSELTSSAFETSQVEGGSMLWGGAPQQQAQVQGQYYQMPQYQQQYHQQQQQQQQQMAYNNGRMLEASSSRTMSAGAVQSMLGGQQQQQYQHQHQHQHQQQQQQQQQQYGLAGQHGFSVTPGEGAHMRVDPAEASDMSLFFDMEQQQQQPQPPQQPQQQQPQQQQQQPQQYQQQQHYQQQQQQSRGYHQQQQMQQQQQQMQQQQQQESDVVRDFLASPPDGDAALDSLVLDGLPCDRRLSGQMMLPKDLASLMNDADVDATAATWPQPNNNTVSPPPHSNGYNNGAGSLSIDAAAAAAASAAPASSVGACLTRPPSVYPAAVPSSYQSSHLLTASSSGPLPVSSAGPPPPPPRVLSAPAPSASSAQSAAPMRLTMPLLVMNRRAPPAAQVGGAAAASASSMIQPVMQQGQMHQQPKAIHLSCSSSHQQQQHQQQQAPPVHPQQQHQQQQAPPVHPQQQQQQQQQQRQPQQYQPQQPQLQQQQQQQLPHPPQYQMAPQVNSQANPQVSQQTITSHTQVRQQQHHQHNSACPYHNQQQQHPQHHQPQPQLQTQQRVQQQQSVCHTHPQHQQPQQQQPYSQPCQPQQQWQPAPPAQQQQQHSGNNNGNNTYARPPQFQGQQSLSQQAPSQQSLPQQQPTVLPQPLSQPQKLQQQPPRVPPAFQQQPQQLQPQQPQLQQQQQQQPQQPQQQPRAQQQHSQLQRQTSQSRVPQAKVPAPAAPAQKQPPQKQTSSGGAKRKAEEPSKSGGNATSPRPQPPPVKRIKSEDACEQTIRQPSPSLVPAAAAPPPAAAATAPGGPVDLTCREQEQLGLETGDDTDGVVLNEPSAKGSKSGTPAAATGTAAVSVKAELPPAADAKNVKAKAAEVQVKEETGKGGSRSGGVPGSSSQKESGNQAFQDDLGEDGAVEDGEDDEGGVMVGRKRSFVQNPAASAARKRRHDMNQRLKVLVDLVPNSSKGDTASMLLEVIEYVKALMSRISEAVGENNTQQLALTRSSSIQSQASPQVEYEPNPNGSQQWVSAGPQQSMPSNPTSMLPTSSTCDPTAGMLPSAPTNGMSARALQAAKFRMRRKMMAAKLEAERKNGGAPSLAKDSENGEVVSSDGDKSTGDTKCPQRNLASRQCSLVKVGLAKKVYALQQKNHNTM